MHTENFAVFEHAPQPIAERPQHELISEARSMLAAVRQSPNGEPNVELLLASMASVNELVLRKDEKHEIGSYQRSTQSLGTEVAQTYFRTKWRDKNEVDIELAFDMLWAGTVLGGENTSRSCAATLVQKHSDILLKNRVESVFEQKARMLLLRPDFVVQAGYGLSENLDAKSSLLNNPYAHCELLQAFGFTRRQTRDIVHAWERIRPNNRVVRAQLGAEMETMYDLHKISPDAPRLLHERYGIRHFSRYGTEQLAIQYQHLNDKRKQRGEFVLGIFAYSDHNDAFTDTAHELVKVCEKSKMRVVFTEARNRVELARRLILVKKLGGKASQVVIAGHGNESHLTLQDNVKREDDPRKMIHTDWMQDSKGLEHLKQKNILGKDADVILASCFNGMPNGVAEYITSQSGVEAIGPENEATTYFKMQGGWIIPDYVDYDAKTGNHQVATARYILSQDEVNDMNEPVV